MRSPPASLFVLLGAVVLVGCPKDGPGATTADAAVSVAIASPSTPSASVAPSPAATSDFEAALQTDAAGALRLNEANQHAEPNSHGLGGLAARWADAAAPHSVK